MKTEKTNTSTNSEKKLTEIPKQKVENKTRVKNDCGCGCTTNKKK